MILLITGSTGIAAATAKLAAVSGASIFIVSNDEASCEILVNEIIDALQKDVEKFSILQLDALGKQINTVPWKGRHFVGNSSVPLHHSSI